MQIIFIIYGKSVHKNECIFMHARLVYYVFFRKSRTFAEKYGRAVRIRKYRIKFRAASRSKR